MEEKKQQVKLMPSTKEKKSAKKATKTDKKQKQVDFKNAIGFVGKLSFRMIVIGVIVAGAFVLYQNGTHVSHLQREMVDLRSAMNTDAVRQHKLQKIIEIIRSHNQSIASDETYDIANTIHEMSLKYTNLDIDLLCAVITHESANTWNPEIVSPAGAMGLMQIMPVTGMFLAKYEEINWPSPEEVLFNPVYNIRMGSRYLSALIQEYDLEGALAAYNGGERNASVYMANGKDDKYLWEETRQYIPAVKSLYHNYLSQGM